MRRLINIFRPLIAILLVLQVSAAYALPAGVHLNLCIGNDGQIDLSPDVCASSPTQPQRHPDTILCGEDHHDDCLDLAIGCVSSEETCPPITKANSSKAKTKRNVSAPAAANYALSFFHRISQSSIRISPHLNGGAFPSSHLVSLSTIVLLI